MTQDALDQDLLSAHARDDITALIHLYAQAADMAPDPDACAFYLTHAFVFALEAGAPQAEPLNARLAAQGRAHQLQF